MCVLYQNYDIASIKSMNDVIQSRYDVTRVNTSGYPASVHV